MLAWASVCVCESVLMSEIERGDGERGSMEREVMEREER